MENFVHKTQNCFGENVFRTGSPEKKTTSLGKLKRRGDPCPKKYR